MQDFLFFYLMRNDPMVREVALKHPFVKSDLLAE